MAEETLTQYLTFRLGDETFALNIERVREILDHTPITRVPRTPPYLRGIINLRGAALPVVDLKRKFRMPDSVDGDAPWCIIVVEVDVDGEPTLIGALVDAVSEVMDVEPAAVGEPPRMGAVVDVQFIKGMVKQGDGFIMLLDPAGILTDEDLTDVGRYGANLP